MSTYVDGFVFPIARVHLDQYKSVAEAVGGLYREYGAIDYVEYVADDMEREGTKSFLELVSAKPDETVVFGWIVYDSVETRNEIDRKIAEDPRMAEWVKPLMDSQNLIFDSARMAFGGFSPLVKSSIK